MEDKSLDNTEMLESTEDFEAMYERHSPAIYRFLFWRTQNNELSEDLTSTVFEKAWRSRDRFAGGSAKAWLHRIARNVLIDHWRKKKEVLVEEPELLQQEATDTDMAEALDRQLEIARMQQAVGRLPDEMREIVRLRFIEGLPSKQVAEKLGLSDSNVRVLQYRALKKLKEYMT